MNSFAWVVGIASAAGIIFGYWGSFTKVGQSHYDEMAGMLPFFIFLGSCGTMALLILFLLIRRMRKKTA